MPEEFVVRDLFDRWERVWHEGQYDLVAGCVAQVYTRHDESGTREVTPEEYAAEIRRHPAGAAEHPLHRVRPFDRGRPCVVPLYSEVDRPEHRRNSHSGGLQAYRVEGGKLAETRLTLLKLGSTWPDTVGQEHWTSAPPYQAE